MGMEKQSQEYLELGRQVFETEIEALKSLCDKLDDNFVTAVSWCIKSLSCHGKLVLTGIGKSGNVCHKVAATLTSTGSVAVVMDGVNALHGDLGIINDGDIVFIFSYSGESSELLNLQGEVSLLEQKKAAAALEEKNLLDKLWDTYELSHEAARAQRVELESVPKAQRRVGELKKSISALGNINLDAIDEFARVNERYTYLTDQRDDVTRSKKELEEIIAGITAEMKTIFGQQFAVINEAFQHTFQELFGGGRATLELEDPEDILNCGIEIRVQPPGKALKVLSLLSGGEKAFVAIALYFAILKVRPTPFCVMDEIEAALDDVNVVRFARYMRQMSEKTQFIVITHRRGTMEAADILYGVTMQEDGISKLLRLDLEQVDATLVS